MNDTATAIQQDVPEKSPDSAAAPQAPAPAAAPARPKEGPVEWAYEKDSRTLTANGNAYKLRATDQELVKFGAIVLGLKRTVMSIDSVIGAFERGEWKSYGGSAKKLQQLHVEAGEAAWEVQNTVRQFEVLFDPKGLNAEFGNDVRQLGAVLKVVMDKAIGA